MVAPWGGSLSVATFGIVKKHWVSPYDLHFEPSRTDQGPQHTHHIPQHTHHIPQLMVFWSIFPLHATFVHDFSKKCSPPSVGSTFLKIDPQHFAPKNPLLGPKVWSLVGPWWLPGALSLCVATHGIFKKRAVSPYDLNLEPSRTDQGPQHTHHIPQHTHHIPELMVFGSIFPLHATFVHHCLHL